MLDAPRALFVTDLDRTLLDENHEVPAVNHDAIRRATAAGVLVAIVTGRRLGSLRRQYDALDGLHYRVATSNGGVVLSPDNETPEHVTALPWSLAEHVAKWADVAHASVLLITAPTGHPDTPGVAPDCLVLEAKSRRWLTSWTPYQEATLVDTSRDRAHSGALVHVAIRLGSRAEAEAAHAVLKPTLTEAMSAHVVRSPIGEGALLEVVPRGGKGIAVRYLAAAHGIDATRTAAVGDELNDCDLLDAANHRYAVGGTVLAQTRDDATEVCSAEKGAVADALDRFLDALDSV